MSVASLFNSNASFFFFSGCDTKSDITFVLDTSDTVGNDNFQKQLEFVKNTVNDLKIAPDKARISIVTYGSGVYNQFFLNQYATKADIINAVSNIPFRGGRTHTADAIRYVSQTSFNPIHGARGDASHVAVFVTNGHSSTPDIVRLQAQTAKDNNVIMYGVGVGSGVDMNELSNIASDPKGRYVLHSESYGSLSGLSGILSSRLCNGRRLIAYFYMLSL